MKIKHTLIALCILLPTFLFGQNEFITTWDMANSGSGSGQLRFNVLIGTSALDYSWTSTVTPFSGNGTIAANTIGSTTITGLSTTGIVTLSLGTSGTQTQLQRFYNGLSTDRSRLTDVTQWGTAAWSSMQFAFYGCNNLSITATDIPDLSGVTNMYAMFYGATAFNQNIGTWNTAAVTDMSYMFYEATAFNQNIGTWNTAAVTTMYAMFYKATAFNEKIGTWNTAAVTTMSYLFSNATDFNQNIDTWNTDAVTNMAYMFNQATAFNQNIASWNTAAVTDMRLMFYQATAFNQNIGAWNTAAVTTMYAMFYQATAFNQNIASWNTAAVTDMSYMFYEVIAFNQNIGAWNTASVTTMYVMFYGATAFNQNISSWNTGEVTNMSYMFNGASAFNQNIGAWNTAAVTDMSQMFYQATAFNQNIGAWNTAAVTDMYAMFKDASAFNQNIGSWNTAAVTDMGTMFNGAAAFNQYIGSWNTALVEYMDLMFSGATAFNQNIGSWTLNTNVDLSNMLDNCGMDCGNYAATLTGWANNGSTPNSKTLGAAGLTYGSYASAARTILTSTKSWTITDAGSNSGNCGKFITRWDLSKTGTGTNDEIGFNATIATGGADYNWEEISPGSSTGSGTLVAGTNTARLITGLPSNSIVELKIVPTTLQYFNINVGTNKQRLTDVKNWGTALWTNMASAFLGCDNLNITSTDLPNLSGVNSMEKMFRGCSILNGPNNINSWNTGTVTNMTELFEGATIFNQNIGSWNTSAVSAMSSMFYQAKAFNQNIGGWNTSAVQYMGFMFYDANDFNQNIGSWNTAAAVNMGQMFYQATAFNQNISAWNTASVTYMGSMFNTATAFNQNISGWNTAAVTNMTFMFSGASSFNRSLGNWTLNSSVDMASMLDNSGINILCYDSTLTAWNASAPNGRTLGATGLFYCASIADRANLVLATVGGGKGWTITGDNQVGGTPTLLASGNTAVTNNNCGFSYNNPSNLGQKLLSLDPNGNTFSPTTVTVNNNNVGTLPTGVTSTNDYYQINNTINTTRVSNRIYSIVAPGSFTTNSGIIVRVYFDQAEHTAMINDVAPAGIIVDWGWYKSASNTAAGVVGDMNEENLTNAINITPTSTGTEGGIDYVEFTVTDFSSFGFYAKTNLIPLPVTLISFTTQNIACNENIIKWTSVDEINLSHYDVEWSANGSKFKAIAQQKSSSNNGINLYSISHNTLSSKNYYRLKSVDMNGTYSYSNIIVANNSNCLNAADIKIMPNPTDGVVKIKYESVEPITVKIYQLDGNLLKTFSLNGGFQSIDIAEFNSGVYCFVILNNGAIIHTERIMKK